MLSLLIGLIPNANVPLIPRVFEHQRLQEADILSLDGRTEDGVDVTVSVS